MTPKIVRVGVGYSLITVDGWDRLDLVPPARPVRLGGAWQEEVAHRHEARELLRIALQIPENQRKLDTLDLAEQALLACGGDETDINLCYRWFALNGGATGV